MPNKNSLEVCKSSAPKQDDAVTAHFIGAAVLLAAAAGFPAVSRTDRLTLSVA
jgi:hypothetical protein